MMASSWRRMMRLIRFIPIVAVFFLSCGKSDRPGSRGNDLPAIQSISVVAPPMIFGGFAIYCDRNGNFVHRDISPNTDQGARFIEKRTVGRGYTAGFQEVAESIDLDALLRRGEGREYGVPDELWLTLTITFANDTSVIAEKWASDEIPEFDAVLERLEDLTATMGAKEESESLEFAFSDRMTIGNFREFLSDENGK